MSGHPPSCVAYFFIPIVSSLGLDRVTEFIWSCLNAVSPSAAVWAHSVLLQESAASHFRTTTKQTGHCSLCGLKVNELTQQVLFCDWFSLVSQSLDSILSQSLLLSRYCPSYQHWGGFDAMFFRMYPLVSRVSETNSLYSLAGQAWVSASDEYTHTSIIGLLMRCLCEHEHIVHNMMLLWLLLEPNPFILKKKKKKSFTFSNTLGRNVVGPTPLCL